MSLGSDLLALRNFVNSKLTQNNTRNITGAQLNSAFIQLLNIVAGVITLANIMKTHHDIVSGDISAGKTVFTIPELISADLFIVSSQSSLYFPIDDLAHISTGDSNLYYTFDPVTGTVTTLDFGSGFSLNIYYRPAA